MNALIGSGFCATSEADFNEKIKWFLNVWLPNVGDRDVFVVDNSDPPVPKLESSARVRVIEVMKNLGHVTSFLGKGSPELCGWSASWIIPAFIAYCEGRDFCYFEADCLAFGEWESKIQSDMKSKGLQMAFGEMSSVAPVEQSLFYIKHWFILKSIRYYLNIDLPDGIKIPEHKFYQMEKECSLVGRHSLPGGRNRPFNLDAPAHYGQKWTTEELAELKSRNLI